MDISTQLTIRAIRARGLNVALDRPVETASGVMKATPLVLVDMETQEGITGHSYVRCYTPVALQPLVRLITNLEELLIGEVAAPVPLEQKLQRHFRLLGPQGLTGIAMAGIDMALWDARARACGVPLVTLLGGVPRPIPAYASLRTMSPEGAAAEAEELLALGFRAIKVKIGRGDLAQDLATIRAMRGAVGNEVKLMVDYNQSLSVAEAMERVRVLDEEQLYWIEEPTQADDFQGHATIKATAQTAIQLGENWWGPHDMAKSIAAQASDYVMLDVMKLGGVTGWLRAAALAESAGLLASSHTFPEFSVHLLAVTPTCHWLEYLDHAGPILRESIRIKDGYALIPDCPGNGLEWNEDILQRWLV
ncbi:mandelate racemase [Reticulibacter mediterranei]|uniref:Mandelate racemase n=1 Tax=Reticulibacter mediterranei TaxID=2778369 RepID=A0A8J3J1P7_9CHLR|nr:enolase C-terminal domain-like protein [Reticulibacter mediterranei]GHO99991.1 mandelate racemase [Reticulibacter mediterranei]